MRVSLDRLDRKLLIAAAGLFLLLVVVALVFSPSGRQPWGYPSSWSNASDGGRAALLLLRARGYQVERWTRPPAELPVNARHDLLILADPFTGALGDRAALRHWLARGGSILATGDYAADLLPEGDVLASPPSLTGASWHPVPAVLPGPLTRNAPVIHMPEPYLWGHSHPDQVPVYADRYGPLVESYRFGHGQILWWASSVPLTNAGISQPGNLELLLNSVAASGSPAQVRIYWDEYFHQLPQGSFWATLATPPLLGALAQLALLFAFVLWTFSRRRGPLWHPLVAGRLAPVEFVETMGALYSRTRASAVALEVALERFRFRISRRFGLEAQASLESLAQAARGPGRSDPQPLLDLLHQCDQSLLPSLPPRQALALVQKLHDETARLEGAAGENVDRGG